MTVARGRRAFEAMLFGAAGILAGALFAAPLVVRRVYLLESPMGALLHYGEALAIALGLRLAARLRGAERSVLADVVFALSLTFVLRRCLTPWLNLEPLDWRSGPAGVATGVVLPLEGLVLGACMGLDRVFASVRVEPRRDDEERSTDVAGQC
jgi:hypothetical protein